MVDKLKQERIAKVAQMRLIDDSLMRVVFRENVEAAQLVIRIILNNDSLIVTDVRVEDPLPNLKGRSVRLDVSAIDSEGRRYDIEIQRADKGAGTRRARYNSSLLDADMLPAGTEPDIALKDSYVIFITEGDPIGRNFPLYHIERTITETGESFDDGSHIIYVNSNIQDDTALGKLMHDFRCVDPEKMYYKPLSTQINDIKNTEEGVEKMCKFMEEEYLNGLKKGREEGREEGLAEGIEKGLEKSITATIAFLKKRNATVSEVIDTLSGTFDISEREAEEKVKLYW